MVPSAYQCKFYLEKTLDDDIRRYTLGRMDTVQVNVRMDEATVKELEQFAQKHGLTKSALARMATLNFLRSVRGDTTMEEAANDRI